jgi:hypothetical protein
MGTVSFFVPDPLPDAHRSALDTACLAGGYDTTPVPTRRGFAPGRLTLTRDGTESGVAMVAWPAAGLPDGTVTLTATLRERPEPYHLLVELARGRVNRLRTQAAEWQQIGLQLEPADAAELKALTRRFGGLVLQPDDPGSGGVAEECLGRAYRLADRLTRTFAEQLLHTRLSELGKLPTRLAVRLSELPSEADRRRLPSVASAVRLVPDWAAIEPTESGYAWGPLDALVDWAAGSGLAVSLGPVVDLAAGRLPDWLWAWSGDLPSLAAFACDFVETVVRRYQDRVGVWVPIGGFNVHDTLGLAEDDRLRLAARLLESAMNAHPGGELVANVAQPWGDYLAGEAHTYTPLVFVDTLVRAGFGFAAIDLHLTAGPPPAGSHPRDALEVYRLLELFAVLGVPLELTTGPADGWPATAAALASTLPQVRQVTWAGDLADGVAGPGGLMESLRANGVV